MISIYCDEALLARVEAVFGTLFKLQSFDLEAQAPQWLDGHVAAIVVASGRAEEARALLGTLWRAQDPILELAPEGDVLALGGQIAAALAQNLQKTQHQLGEARHAIAQMRAESMTLNRRLRGVEHVLSAIGNPQYLRALEWQPLTDMMFLPQARPFTQRLPLEAQGVVAVDIWVQEAGQSVSENLRLTLRDDTGSRTALAPWGQEWSDLAGWLRFVAPEPLEARGQNLWLEVEWTGEGEVQLGLGLSVPDQKFWLDLGEGEQLDQVLALQVWKAEGAAALPSAARAQAAALAASDMIAERVMPSDLERPTIFFLPPGERQHAKTEFWAKEDAHLVHPNSNGVICAVVRNVPVPDNFSYVSAQVMVGSAIAAPLNFAIGVAPAGQIGAGGNWRAVMGPWLTGLPPTGWGQVSAHIGAPHSGSVDLFLAVSSAASGPIDQPWGLFRSYRLVGAK